jgi:hypothetical protein
MAIDRSTERTDWSFRDCERMIPERELRGMLRTILTEMSRRLSWRAAALLIVGPILATICSGAALTCTENPRSASGADEHSH